MSNFVYELLTIVGMTLAPSVFAQNAAISFQGQLADGGVPADGAYDFQFHLFDSLLGGNEVTNPILVTSLKVTNGVFQVALDFGLTSFQGNARFVQVDVRTNSSTDAFDILSPRRQLSPVPFALYALSGTPGPQGPQGPPGPAGTWTNKIVQTDINISPLTIQALGGSSKPAFLVSDESGIPIASIESSRSPLGPTALSRGSITLHNTQIRNRADDARFLQVVPTITNTPSFLQLFPRGDPLKVGDTERSSLQLFHSDITQYPDSYEAVEFTGEVVNGTPVFYINTFAAGGGIQRPFQIRVNGSLAVDFSDDVAVRFALPPRLPTFLLSNRPSGLPAGSMIFVTDAPDGSKVQAWDGFKWIPLG